jgi:hypothetical protein
VFYNWPPLLHLKAGLLALADCYSHRAFHVLGNSRMRREVVDGRGVCIDADASCASLRRDELSKVDE